MEKDINIKDKVIELIKKIESIGDIDEILLSTQNHYRYKKKKPKSRRKRDSIKKSEFLVKYKERDDSDIKEITYDTLREVAEGFGIELGRVTYCTYKKIQVDGNDCKIISIEKINK